MTIKFLFCKTAAQPEKVAWMSFPTLVAPRHHERRAGRLRDEVSERQKDASADGASRHGVGFPVQFLARLASLVPPPRHPSVRYKGTQCDGSTRSLTHYGKVNRALPSRDNNQMSPFSVRPPVPRST